MSNPADGTFRYEAVPVDEDLDLVGSAEAVLSGDPSALETLIRGVEEAEARDAPPPIRPELVQLPVVIDDFIRNYFTQNGFMKSLEAFELEWYTKHGSVPQEQAMTVPDVYLEMAQLQDKNNLLGQELQRQKDTAVRSVDLWEKAKKERDLHKVNHTRVVQEKTRMVRDMKRLQDHTQSIEPTVLELKAKYENAQKERMLLRLDRDKLAAKVQALEEQLKNLDQERSAAAASASAGASGLEGEGSGTIGGGSRKNKSQKKSSSVLPTSSSSSSATAAIHPGGAMPNHLLGATVAPSWPADNRPNTMYAPGVPAPTTPSNYGSWSVRHSIKGKHTMSVPCVVCHPKGNAAASCSDDGSWKIYTLPRGETIVGRDLSEKDDTHSSWISSIALHPKGNIAATGSGDMTVKLWRLHSNTCTYTLKAHADAVMCVDFHDSGELLMSGSLDHSVRIWDVETGKVRQGLRGHKEAVNSCVWQPFTNTALTASADKSVSVWDARTGSCAQTLLGHRAAVAQVATMPISATQYEIASCDARGLVVRWDLRMLQAKNVYRMGGNEDTLPANSLAFDFSGKILAVACDDNAIRMINLEDDKTVGLRGHEDSVLSVAFDPHTNNALVSSGADGTVKYWQ